MRVNVSASYSLHLRRPHGVVDEKGKRTPSNETNGTAGVEEGKYIPRLLGSGITELGTYLVKRWDIIFFCRRGSNGDVIGSGNGGWESVCTEHRLVRTILVAVAHLPAAATAIGWTAGVRAGRTQMA